MEDGTITLKLIKHGERTIEVERAAYEQAKRDETLDFLLDADISDLTHSTVVIEPDGTEIDPFYI